MNYINHSTLEVKNYYVLKSDNSNVSIAADGTEVIMDVWYLIHPTSKPSYDVNTERVVETEPAFTGVYTQTWEVLALSALEISDLLLANVESGQNSLDESCEAYILSYWSANAQSNVSMGIYEQSVCELCKDEIGLVLSENSVFVTDVSALTTKEDIDLYVDNVVRVVITGGQ